jgi:hypothetical protein
MHKNCLIVQAGRNIAAKIAGRIEFFAEVDATQQMLMRKSLQVGRRVHAAPEPAVISEPHVHRRPARLAARDETQLHSRRRFGL